MYIRSSAFFLVPLACLVGLGATTTVTSTEQPSCLLQKGSNMEKVADANSADGDIASGGRRRRRKQQGEIEKRLDDIEGKLDDISDKLSTSNLVPDTSPGGGPQPRLPRRSPDPSPSQQDKPSPSPSPTSDGGADSEPAAAEGKVPVSLTDRWINAHNYWRCIHNTGPVTWDADVAAGAQKWIDDGHTGHADCYNLPNPQGPTGENIAGGTGLSPEMSSAMWHDENPERGPGCGGHCTAMLWKSANRLGCGFVKPKEGGGMMAMSRSICRYGGGVPLNKRLAANFGGRRAKEANVAYPDNSRADECKKKWPPAKGLEHSKEGGREGGGGMGGGGMRPGSGGDGFGSLW